MINKIFFVLLFLPSILWATTFQVLPLEKLVEESNGAAEVQLKEKKSFMNKMGLIMTEFSFSVLEAYNLDNSDLGGESLKITMTGGSVDGVTSYIDGAPEFEVGEKSFLLLKKVESKIYLSNFTMGKYKIEEREGKTYYVSTVFPADPDMGKVSKERMIDVIRTKFKISDNGEKPTVTPVSVKEKGLFKREAEVEKRSPAQEGMDVNSSQDGLVAMWVFFFLTLISGFTIWWKLKKGVRT